MARSLVITLCGMTVVAVVGAVALYIQATRFYVELQTVRLDPTSADFFEPVNKALSPVAAGQKRVVYFGDSRIAMWQDLPAPAGCQVVNRGKGSETTAQLLMRLDPDVLALNPDVVVLQLGVNDLKTLGVFPDRQAQIIQSATLNTDTLLNRLVGAKVRVLVLTIFPVGSVPLIRRPMWSDKTLDAIAQFNQRLRGLNQTGVITLDCDPVLAQDGRIKPAFALDTLHMRPSGYLELNKIVEPVLAQMLKPSAEKK